MNNSHPILRVAQASSIVVIGSYFFTWHSNWLRSEKGYEILLSILKGFDVSLISVIGLLVAASPIVCHAIYLIVTNMAHSKKTALTIASIPTAIWIIFASYILINNWGYWNIVRSFIPVKQPGGCFMLAGVVVGFACSVVYFKQSSEIVPVKTT